MPENKIALVTGGSRGIGRAICVALAKEGYGIVINYHENVGAAEETRELVEKEGVPAELCQGDITARSHRDLVVTHAMERFGRIDMLVNNAGVAPKVRTDILETDEKSFDQVLGANLRAPYFLTGRVAREMISLIQGGAMPRGTIVNISSLRRYTTARNYGEYCISKAAVSMMTKLFAVRLAEHGINVYEISPGIIETDMTSGKDVRAYYNSKLDDGMAPINRWGRPEEVALAVGAIARGSFPFSTGTIFDVDGGFHLREL